MIIISNGFSKFHLSVAAAEANRRHILTSFLTGAYPTPFVRKILSLPYLRTNAKTKRLAARREEIPDKLIHPLFSAEAVHLLGIIFGSRELDIQSLRFYGRRATHHVEHAADAGARIYHYRAGFGGESAETARKRGMFLLCDHSIAHPMMVEALMNHGGRMPDPGDFLKVEPVWPYFLEDIDRADAVLVNSDFVADTFRHLRYDRIPIHVIYWGIDDAFLDQVPERETVSGEFRLLYAGTFDKRKGAQELMDALERVNDIPWRLEIAGPVQPQMAEAARSFFSHPRVKYLGMLSRPELAKAMARAEVFVFPSLAEGSARVVFEALACGCYIITTPNAGSIVQDGVHGAVVPPGDSMALSDAIEAAFRRRDQLAQVGSSNKQCIRARYKQSDYGDQLAELYAKVLSGS